MRRSSSGRYLLARLRPLGRPIVWAPAIALLLVMLFAWEFFSQAEWISYFGITPASENETVSREDQAIGADIDSLPLLMNDIKIATKPEPGAIVTAPQNPTQPTRPNPASTGLLSAQPSNDSTQPKLDQPTQGVFGVFRNALTAQLGLTSSISESANPSVPLPQNPLQAALAKLAATETRTAQASTPIEGTTRLDPPTSATTRSPYTNSYTNLIEGSQPIPPAGIAVPTVAPPIAPSPVISAPLPSPSPASDLGVQAAPAVEQPVNQQPFTVPRPIPNRPIGGGNINTFSNP